MVTQRQFDHYAAWMIKARQDAKKAKAAYDRQKAEGRHYSLEDYDVRKRGDHYESYNKLTGETLFEAFTMAEARADLREEFGGS